MYGAHWNWLSTHDAIVYALSCFGQEEICWRWSRERFLLTSTMVAGDVLPDFLRELYYRLTSALPLWFQAEVDLLS